MKKILTFASIFFLLPISVFAAEGESSYPKTARKERWENFGSVVGGDGGITVYDSNPNAQSVIGKKAPVGTMNVNPYLWQASVDIVSFMPIQVSDSSGGVISTDWYEDPDYPGIRYRVNILVKAVELKATNLKVTVFKQEMKDGNWREVKPNSEIGEDLEEKILTKARELKVSQEH